MEQDLVGITTLIFCGGRNANDGGTENVRKGEKAFPPKPAHKHAHTDMSVGSGACSTITSAGIMKMSSMSP